MSGFTESIVEDAALAWLKALGYTVLHGPAIAVGEPGAERSDPICRHNPRKPRPSMHPGEKP